MDQLKKIFAATGLIALVIGLAGSAIESLPSSVITAVGWIAWALFVVVMGALLGLFVLPLFPFLVDKLVIRPNADKTNTWPYPKNEFGFFTYLHPGQVKMIERWGGTFVRAIMDYDGRMFIGERRDNDYTPDQEEYWTVVKTGGGHHDSHPIPFPGFKAYWWWIFYSPISIAWWLWKLWVYRLTGAVFVGIPGYQTLRIYPLERFKKAIDSNGEVTLQMVKDYSDHYRVAEFQSPIRLPSADTQDLMRVWALFNNVLRVENPFFVAYNTNNEWPMRLLASSTASIAAAIRFRPAEEVVAAKNKDEARKLEADIQQELANAVASIGLAVVKTEYMDIDYVDEKDAEKMADKARSLVDKQAAENRAKGNAAPIREFGQALKDFPEAGIIPQTEALVRATQAAAATDKAFIFLGDPRSINPLDAAQIKELRNLQQGSKSP